MLMIKEFAIICLFSIILQNRSHSFCPAALDVVLRAYITDQSCFYTSSSLYAVHYAVVSCSARVSSSDAEVILKL